MHIVIEKKVPLFAGSVRIGASQWSNPATWACPQGSYVVCQRLSGGHPPLRLVSDGRTTAEAYTQIRSLGFMPTEQAVTMQPVDAPLRTLNCYFDKNFFEDTTEIDANGWYDRAGSLTMVSNRLITTLMMTIYNEVLNPRSCSSQMIDAASKMIALEMGSFGKRLQDTETPLSRINGLAPWQMRRIRERIQIASEAGYPSIDELATLCRISEGHLMRMFKLSTGQSLYRFITLERINAARAMLAEDKISIKDIAARLGYCNTAHFTNAFRRIEAITPSQFRLQSQLD